MPGRRDWFSVQNREIIDTNDILHNTLNKHPGGLANHRRTSSISIFAPLSLSDRRPSRCHNAVQYVDAEYQQATETDYPGAAGLSRAESMAGASADEEGDETMMASKRNHRSVEIIIIRS